MVLAIRKIRKAKGMTQLELSQRAGFDRVATISALENGKGNPTLSTLQQIAAALGVTERELFSADRAETEISEMINGVKMLSPEDRAAVLALVRRLAQDRH